jgi:hypothetical protein
MSNLKQQLKKTFVYSHYDGPLQPQPAMASIFLLIKLKLFLNKNGSFKPPTKSLSFLLLNTPC